MNCAELQQRIVDPASSSIGGHAPVVEHLQSCAECRSRARIFAEIEKLFGTLESGVLAGDFDERVRRRLTRPGSRLAAVAHDRRWIAAGALVVALGAVALLWPSPATKPSPVTRRGGTPATGEPGARAAPPDILAVRSTPIALSSTPLGEEEKSVALALDSREFLGFVPALGTLEPFFPESLPPAAPAGSPGAPQDMEQRLTEWQDAAAAERVRWREADAAFRARDASERDLLRSRWRVVAEFSSEEKAGLRRLAGRIADLDGKRRARFTVDLRALERAPAPERRLRWRALPFTRTLTGQETASGERLLLSF